MTRTAKDAAADPQNWRHKYQQASFRGAIFFVDTDARSGGRRVAPHEYPKRNTGYAEDMGKRTPRFIVQGYLLGHEAWGAASNFPQGTNTGLVNYLDLKDALIDALEADGPGMLRLPLPYRMQDVNVMVQQYTVTESREKGGFCAVEMDFLEYGDPNFRQQVATASAVDQAATNMETAMLAVSTGVSAAGLAATDAFAKAASYYQVWMTGQGAAT